ncbi:MAG: SDR family oxidoreductase [Acidimicrobiales bacterium]
MTEHSWFDGGVALVTGGTQGLGLAVAEGLKGRGARGLMLVGRDVSKGQRAARELAGDGCEVRFVPADLATADACRSVIDALDECFGTCHAFVSCAARTDRGDVWTTTAELWQQMLAVNVTAPAVLSQGVARLMVREGVGGSIVLIGSVVAHGGPPRLLAYSTSKGALIALTRSLAYQLMRHRVRVNLLNPGWMDTPGEDVTQRRWEGATDGWLPTAEAGMPFGQLIKPADIARTIVHLATAESGMLTGAAIDWDQSVAGAGPAPVPPAELGAMP